MDLDFGGNEEINLHFSEKNERIIGHLIKISAANAEGIENHLSHDLLNSIDVGLNPDTGIGMIVGPAHDIGLMLKFADAFSGDIIFPFGRHDFEESSENYGFVTLVDGLYDKLPITGECELAFRQLFEDAQWKQLSARLAEYLQQLPATYGIITFDNVTV